MDGPRGYQDETDGRWYPGFTERYQEPEGRYDDDRYRTPEPRYSDEPRYSEEPSGDLGRYRGRPDPLTDPALAGRPLGPRSGVELPPMQADPLESFGGEQRYPADPIDRGAPRRPSGAGTSGAGPTAPGPSGPPAAPGQAGVLPPMPTVAAKTVEGGAIYRTRRVGVAALLTIVAVVAELMMVRVLATGLFAHTVQPNAVLAGLFAMCGTPLVTMGLYGLMTGAATAGGPTPGRAWLRTPLAYLPVGLALLVAAGMAAA